MRSQKPYSRPKPTGFLSSVLVRFNIVGLGVTQLELATAALPSMNLITHPDLLVVKAP